MAKFIKIHEKYCGRTFDPAINIPVDGIQWFRNIPTCKGEDETYISVCGIHGSFAITETVEELNELIY